MMCKQTKNSELYENKTLVERSNTNMITKTKRNLKPRFIKAASCALVIVLAGCGGGTTGSLTESGGNSTSQNKEADVIAVETINPEVAPSEECIQQTPCLRQWYQALTWQIGPEKALQALEANGEKLPELQKACHDTTHAIGEVAAYMKPLSEAMGLGDTSCGSGFYHGVIATTTTRVDPDKILDVLVGGCKTGTGFKRWECFHGVGHGLVFAASGDIYKGIETCEKIVEDSDRGACGSGAFMQELADHGGDTKYKEDPYLVCRTMTETIIAGQCYDMLANIVVIHRKTPAEHFAMCDTVELDLQSNCYQGLGRARFAGMPFVGKGIEDYCGLAQNESGSILCYEAAFANTAAYYGNSDEAKSHCPELSTEALRGLCETYLTENRL